MPLYRVFFYSALFFLAGVLLKSFDFDLYILLVTGVIFAGFLFLSFFKHKKTLIWLAFLSLLIIPGALYFNWHDSKIPDAGFDFDQKTTLRGMVSDNPVEREGKREFKFETKTGSVLIKTGLYPKFEYGDVLEVTGEVERPFSKSYRNYLRKEEVLGLVYFPEIELIEENAGSDIKSFLYSARNKAESDFKKFLPPLEAAFMNGITFGGYSGFASDFKEEMSRSGTTHLVALSGYNISILVVVIMGLFSYFIKRRYAFWFTVSAVVMFVIMTGAEASVVRAAVMGVLALLAIRAGRVYDQKNAIIFAALIMVLHNPEVLVFDIGFQLSFLALLGIVYLRPLITRLPGFSENQSFLSWKENFATTASAQLMVAPVLLLNFDYFSPVSLLANVAILEFIPITMGLGFLLEAVSFISYYLALMLGWAAGILLGIETFLIKLFADISFSVGDGISIVGFFVYYFIIAVAIIMYRRKMFYRKEFYV